MGMRWGGVGFTPGHSLVPLYLCVPSHFSILGAWRTWKFMGTVMFTAGLKQTVCFGIYTDDTIIKFWSWVFLLSKVVELGECRGFVSGAQ